MKGAPAKAIQELAGHQNLGTTLRYMHLSPAARESAIHLLDGPEKGAAVETLWRRVPSFQRNTRKQGVLWFRRRDSNPDKRYQKPLSCR